ncbi:MAG: glycosyltransferase [Patescibacteria group bacterium]
MKDEKKRPIKVLHIIGGFNVGGIETWLLNVTRNLPASDYQFDFFAISSKEAALDNEIFKLGCKLFKSKSIQPSLFSIYDDLKKIVRENGPYDAFHSHVHYFGGFIVLVGYILKIPVRIVHSHTDTRLKESHSNFLRRVYIESMRLLVHLFATKGVGGSSETATDQFGKNWAKDSRWQVLPCGIDFKRFDIPRDRLLSLSLGIPVGAKVIGHIGRFEPVKNHFFLIKLFKKMLDRGNNIFLLLVGDGSLKGVIEKQVRNMGISDRVIFLGLRDDVPNLLRSVIDVFLLPSLYEGLPLAFIEAQLAGCYCLGADTFSKEAVLNSKSTMLLNLEGSFDEWVNKAEDFLSRPKIEDSEMLLSQYRNSTFDLKTNIKRLLSLYHNEEYQK